MTVRSLRFNKSLFLGIAVRCACGDNCLNL